MILKTMKSFSFIFLLMMSDIFNSQLPPLLFGNATLYVVMKAASSGSLIGKEFKRVWMKDYEDDEIFQFYFSADGE